MTILFLTLLFWRDGLVQSSTQSILASMIVVSFIFRTFQDIVFHLHVRFAMNTTKLDGIAILFNVVSMTFPWGSTSA